MHPKQAEISDSLSLSHHTVDICTQNHSEMK